MNTTPRRNLEQDLDALGQALVPSKALAPAIVAQFQPLTSHHSHVLMRKWGMRTTLGLAAALILAVVLIISTLLQPAVAFAQVLKKVEQTKTFTCDIQADERMHILISDKLMRAEMPDGSITVGNLASGRWVSLNPKTHAAVKMTLARQPFDLYAWFKDFKDGKEERLGGKELNGHNVAGFKVSRQAPNGIPGAEPVTLIFTFWVDPATTLPVEAEGKENGHDIRFTNLKWNEPLDEKLFSMTVPPDYKVQDMGGITEDQLKTPPTTQEAQSITLKPGVGIGALKFGDTPKRITDILGKPETLTSEVSWGYPSKGIWLTVLPKSGLTTISAASKKALPIFNVNDFSGKTDTGLGIGATRELVEAQYGKPQRIDKIGANTVTLYYDNAYICFMVQSGHVIQIFLEPPPSAIRNATMRATQPATGER